MKKNLILCLGAMLMLAFGMSSWPARWGGGGGGGGEEQGMQRMYQILQKAGKVRSHIDYDFQFE